MADKWPAGATAQYSTKDLPVCANTYDITASLKAYISASYIIGTTVVNGNIVECSIQNGCNWTLDADATTTFGGNNLGLRAGLELKGTVQGTVSPHK